MQKGLGKYLMGSALLATSFSASAQAQNTAQSSAASAVKPGSVGPNVPAFTVRSGYRVTSASENLGQLRFLEFDTSGKVLFATQPDRDGGKVLALRDKNNDGVYESQTDFVTGKKSAHGMHFHNGWLWFTQSGAVHRARDTNGDDKADEVVAVLENLPQGGHWWRTILVTDDGFFTSIGDSGNINDETATDRQKIWKYSLDGKERKLWSSGIRNTEKLRFRPGTQELWGADHDSDNFGKLLGETQGNQPVTDLLPPCEFNKYTEGAFYGHPFITATGMPRLEFRERPDILELAAKTTPPAWLFGAHWAPNGWTFSTKNTLGTLGDAYVAAHGSWNSTKKVGYRIERVMFDPMNGTPMGGQFIVSTLTPDGKNNLARPVDCVEAPDGSILWSCDQTNRIYRISPEAPAQPARNIATRNSTTMAPTSTSPNAPRRR
jgi:glucose/arabinose dehydrogenase